MASYDKMYNLKQMYNYNRDRAYLSNPGPDLSCGQIFFKHGSGGHDG